MTDESESVYHMRRARAELDLAYRSDCRAAIEAHLRLYGLHMQRLSHGAGDRTVCHADLSWARDHGEARAVEAMQG